jgi:hypothetical protein
MDRSDANQPARTSRGGSTIHRGTVFSVERVSYVGRAGRELERDVVRHPGAVTVIPVLDDGRLVMIRNWRVAVGAWLDEFCASKLEPGEDPALAAARELGAGHSAPLPPPALPCPPGTGAPSLRARWPTPPPRPLRCTAARHCRAGRRQWSPA